MCACDYIKVSDSIFSRSIPFRPAIHSCLCPRIPAMHKYMMGLQFLQRMAHELSSYPLKQPSPSWLIQETTNISSNLSNSKHDPLQNSSNPFNPRISQDIPFFLKIPQKLLPFAKEVPMLQLQRVDLQHRLGRRHLPGAARGGHEAQLAAGRRLAGAAEDDHLHAAGCGSHGAWGLRLCGRARGK